MTEVVDELSKYQYSARKKNEKLPFIVRKGFLSLVDNACMKSRYSFSSCRSASEKQ